MHDRSIFFFKNYDNSWVPYREGGINFKNFYYKGRGVTHSTSWKYSISWKFNLQFIYILRTDWNFLMEFCGSDLSFNINILSFIFLKFKTSAHAQIAITHYQVLFTNLLTWYEIETYIWDRFWSVKWSMILST